MGRSIGSGPACHYASTYACAGLVLISPFTSIKEVVRNSFGSLLSTFIKDRFDNLSKISQVEAPTLLIHGKEDELVPPEHSENLFSKQFLLEKNAKGLPRSSFSAG